MWERSRYNGCGGVKNVVVVVVEGQNPSVLGLLGPRKRGKAGRVGKLFRQVQQNDFAVTRLSILENEGTEGLLRRELEGKRADLLQGLNSGEDCGGRPTVDGARRQG